MRFSSPGIPIRITPISAASKIARTCSRLAMRSLSASSMMISVVGSPIARSCKLYFLAISPYEGRSSRNGSDSQ